MMTKKAYIVAAMISERDTIPSDGDLIGVDYGAFYLASKGFRMEYAIGDFDSVTEEELKLIKKSCNYFVELPENKDETDSEYAINIAFSNDYEEVIMLGVLGGRADHFYANLMLLLRYYKKKVAIMNYYNYIQLLGRGNYLIPKQNYKYLSVFAMEPSSINLTGVKYPLEHYVLNSDSTIGTSNEISESEAQLTVNFGHVLVIQANDRKKQ